MSEPAPREVRFETAAATDAPALAALHTVISDDLTARCGEGHWSRRISEKGVLLALRTTRIRVARHHGEICATYTLATKKPWAIDIRYFTPCARALYLVNMAVDPAHQRQGLGRLCIADAKAVATDFASSVKGRVGAIRLDTYDGAAGAAGFYAKAGLGEVGRVDYRRTPLVYFELLL